MMWLFHVWKLGLYCWPPKIDCLATTTNFICMLVIFQLIGTDYFQLGTSVKCRRHSKYFHWSPILYTNDYNFFHIIYFFEYSGYVKDMQIGYIYQETGSIPCFLKVSIPTYNNITVQPVITWEYIWFTLYIIMFCHLTQLHCFGIPCYWV